MSNFQDVRNFHIKFMVPQSEVPALLDPTTQEFREKFLAEELKELTDCYVMGDLEGVVDALVDLVYVAMGTAAMMGVPWQRVWDNVHMANMMKRLAKPDGSDSKRGSPLDVVKPEGWKAPDHKEALGLQESDNGCFIFDATMALQKAIQARKSLPELGPEWTAVQLVRIGQQVWIQIDGRYITPVEVTLDLIELFGEKSSLWFEAKKVMGQVILGENIPAPVKGQSC